MSGRRGHKITLGMLKGKSITTSVPSIAIRFHSGDEEVDIYPSADDEEEEEKEEGGVSPPTVSPSPTPSIPSRDPSPMKEYLRGLGKRSTSVDGGMADAGSSTSDTWRIFHELKGKITKTVEEKLTEMKNDRKASGTPKLSGIQNRRRRLRAGGFDNSSISDSEDISEASNKGETREVVSSEASVTPDRNVKFTGAEDEVPSTSTERGSDKKKNKKEKHKKNNKSGGLQSDSSGTESHGSNHEVVEPGVEILEETRFAPEEDYDDVPTIDYRTNPPTILNADLIDAEHPVLRGSNSFRSIVEHIKGAWYYRYVLIAMAVLLVYYFFPLSMYQSGILMGIFLTLSYHFTVGLAAWCEPDELPLPFSTSFSIPNYQNLPLLKVPSLEYMTFTPTKCAGWMNELPTEEYNSETYHINNTQTVYVHLEGSILKISHPKSKVQRRATWNEKKYKLKFIHQRIYNIAGCRLKLLPDGLTRKRTWSKKYPICIKLTTGTSVRKSVIDLTKLIVDKEDDQLSLISREDSANEMLAKTMEKAVNEEGEEDLDDDASIDNISESRSKTSLQVNDPTLDYESLALLAPPPVVRQPSAEPIHTPSDEDTFCLVDDSVLNETRLFLFARTDRQKEDWYSRLAIAVRKPVVFDDGHVEDPLPAETTNFVPEPTFTATGFSGAEFITRAAHELAPDEYLEHMNRYDLEVKPFAVTPQIKRNIAVNTAPLDSAPSQSTPHRTKQPYVPLDVKQEIDGDIMWINAMAGHVLYDLLRHEVWRQKIRAKVEKKLEAIKTPYFMEKLILRDIEFGHDVPLIHRASRPVIDAHGLWIDLDVSFQGRVCLTIETKLNLMKLKKQNGEQEAAQPEATMPTEQAASTSAGKSKSPIYDSEIEDSAESSETEPESHSNKTSSDTDGKSVEASPSKKPATPATGKGMIRMMSKIVSSKYFQQATENKYIKRAMEGVSNTTITLTVEIRGLTGQLAVNMPPPPSDRLWYGFRGNPRVWIKARPKFGDRHLNIKHVVTWIEKKLMQEFRKKLVVPNMDDLVIPPMTTDLPK